jgi:hypothetical protein
VGIPLHQPGRDVLLGVQPAERARPEFAMSDTLTDLQHGTRSEKKEKRAASSFLLFFSSLFFFLFSSSSIACQSTSFIMKSNSPT